MGAQFLVDYVTAGVFGSESGPCLGVDIGEASLATPIGECGRVYYGADDFVPVAQQFAFALFGLGQPSGVGCGQDMGIRHDRARRCIVGFAIPRHSNSADFVAGDRTHG